MTRKRFVKLAMSRGMQRNDAERMARTASGTVSYDKIFETVIKFRSGLGEVVAAVVELIWPVAKAISEWIFELDPETLKELAKLDED